MTTRQTTIKLTVADNFSSQLRSFANAVDNAERQTNELAGAANKTSAATKGMSSIMGGLSQLGLGVTMAGLTYGMIEAGKASLKLAMDMEQTKIAFTTMTGSAEKAQQHLDELRAFAATTPFQFTDLTKASKKMQAFGFSVEQVIPMMTDIGDAVSALGGGAEKIDRVTIALGQMQAKGKIQAQEMLQLTEAGIPAWRYLAEAMGMSTAEVMKLSEKGLIPADKAIQAILAGMREDFGGLMAQQATTAAGKMSNLVDKLEAFGTAIGEEALPATNKLIDGLSNAVDATSTLVFWQKNLQEITAKHAEDVSLSAVSYEEYSTELRRAAEAAGYQVDAEGRLIDAFDASTGIRNRVIDDNYLLSESEREAAQQMESWAGITDRANDGFRDTAGAMDDMTASMTSAKDAQELLKLQTENLQKSQEALVAAALGGKMSEIYDKYSESVNKSSESIAELEEQLGELNSEQGTSLATATELADLSQRIAEAKQKEADAGYDLWRAQQNLNENTDPQKQYELEQAIIHMQLAYDGAVISTQKLNEAYAESSTAVVDNSDKINELNEKITKTKEEAGAAAEAMHQQTAELIYQAASIGLTTDAQLELARSMGLIDEQSYSTQIAIQNLRDTFDKNKDGMIEASEGASSYLQAIRELNTGISETQVAGGQIGRNFEDAQYWISVARDRASELRDISNSIQRWPSGGATTGGAMRVERDEIVVAPKGGQVLNKQEAAAVAGGKGGGREVNITNHISDRMDSAQFMAQLRQVLQFA